MHALKKFGRNRADKRPGFYLCRSCRAANGLNVLGNHLVGGEIRIAGKNALGSGNA